MTDVGHPWRGASCWRALDTCFDRGQGFLATWLHWRQDPQRPRVLHYVALCGSAPTADDLIDVGANHDDLRGLARTLASQWDGLRPGFHRFLLEGGQIILTMCVGDALSALRQQDFDADEIIVSLSGATGPTALDLHSLWSAKALASCCRRGTRLHGRLSSAATAEMALHHLRQCGFALDTQAASDQELALDGLYDPPWTDARKRRRHQQALPIERCAVIGAGLSGASVAASLARRGWQVTVFDQASNPAAGASGLPLGLVVPHVSRDDCTLSRLSRAGVRLLLQQAQQHLRQGQDWGSTGVLTRQIGSTPPMPWPAIDDAETGAALDDTRAALGEGLWHAKGAWIKPAALVRAWLKEPGVQFVGNAEVVGLRQAKGQWQLLDGSGAVLGCAERVVLANANGARRLIESAVQANAGLNLPIERLPATQDLRGLLSHGLHQLTQVPESDFPKVPVNGAGAMVAHIPTPQGSAWFMGSTYQPGWQTERSAQDNHLLNFEHLQQLLPPLARLLEGHFKKGEVQSWKGTRCVAADRLPLVGALKDSAAPGLWLCAAMGSRGLSFSVLCAELLAARMGAEPLPVSARMARSLNALRA